MIANQTDGESRCPACVTADEQAIGLGVAPAAPVNKFLVGWFHELRLTAFHMDRLVLRAVYSPGIGENSAIFSRE